MTHRFWLTLLVLAVWLMPLSPAQAAPSGGVVGGSCLESDLDAALAGGGTVTFNCGGPKSIVLSAPKLINQSTTVDGSGGITLDGNDSVSIFVVTPTATLRLKNINLNNASGGASDGGAIKNHGTLYLDHTTIQSSHTDSNHSGGAIFSDGPVFISDSLLEGNQAGSAGALFANFGQAIVAITNTTVSLNQAINTISGFGGAIWVGAQAQVSITGGAIQSNTAKYGGGAYLTAGGTLTLTATGAPAIVSGNSATNSGGGIDNKGGQAAVTNTTFSGNSAAAGGGVYNDYPGGPLTLTHVTLSGNTAQFGGGGVYNDYGTATLANVIISGNVVTNTFDLSTYGAGIENYGLLTLTNSTVSGNAAHQSLSADSFGGGLYNNAVASQDMATLTNDTFSGNSAENGGGILNVGTLTLTNSTLNANLATSTGGGLENYQALALLTNDTLSGNSANTGGGVYQQGQAPTQTLTLINTIVASGLSGANCVEEAGSFGSLLSAGYNLSNEGTCAPFFTQPTDLNNQNPNLGPLANHGGPTLTQLPNLPSPAIDAIPNGANGCGTTLTTDQRGVLRPFHGRCDVGAVEAVFAFPRLWLPLLRR